MTATTKYRHRFLVSISRQNFQHAIIEYSPVSRGNYPGARLAERIAVSAGTVVFNSATPLRYMSVVGIGGSILAFTFALYSLFVHVWKKQVVEGWTTLMLVISSLFLLQFLILAFLSEYISRLVEDASGHREYSVLHEKHSSVMMNESRNNVVDQSGSGQS